MRKEELREIVINAIHHYNTLALIVEGLREPVENYFIEGPIFRVKTNNDEIICFERDVEKAMGREEASVEEVQNPKLPEIFTAIWYNKYRENEKGKWGFVEKILTGYISMPEEKGKENGNKVSCKN